MGMPFLSHNLESATGSGDVSHPSDVDARGNAQSNARGNTQSNTIPYARTRRYVPWVVAAVSLLLMVVIVLVGFLFRGSMHDLTRDSLRSMLSANVNALEMWLAETRKDVSRILETETIAQASRELLSEFDDVEFQTDEVLANSNYNQLKEQLDNSRYFGWALVNDQSRVVASDRESLIGQSLPLTIDNWEQLQARRSVVTVPFRCPVPILDEGPFSREGSAIMCAMAPITEGARTVGSLALLLDPLDQFSDLLAIARTGGSGETYAFDRKGMMISQSRFEHQLRAAGLLDSDPNVSSPLNVEVRDPQVNLILGDQPPMAREDQPLTLMADRATRGATGENVVGYNDYRGVPVVGAWTWLHEYDFGVATEIDVDQAYRPMQFLQRSFFGLLCLIGICAICLLLFASMFRRLSERLRVLNRKARKLGQYELGEVIGRGGMGAVYRGRHQLLRRDVAIKVLEGDDVGDQAVDRFEREVQLTSQLRHSNTIDIYDYGTTADGTFFYVMEYIEGITLHELVEDFGCQPPGRVIHLLRQICGSLSEAHQMGMVHRDVKPSNILVTASAGVYDMIKVLDFGLVKSIDSGLESSTKTGAELTTSDGITGTPMYMSPECVRDAANAGPQSDLYSLGAVGYTLLTGLPLYDGDGSVDICMKQLREDPLRPADRIGHPLPDDLQNVLMSCLRKNPEDRLASIDDLESALGTCGDSSTWGMGDAMDWWEVDYRNHNELMIDRGEVEPASQGVGSTVR